MLCLFVGWDSPTPGPSWDVSEYNPSIPSSTGSQAPTNPSVEANKNSQQKSKSSSDVKSEENSRKSRSRSGSTDTTVSYTQDSDSGDSSDVMITEVEKPWTERSPILLSSDSEPAPTIVRNKSRKKKSRSTKGRELKESRGKQSTHSRDSMSSSRRYKDHQRSSRYSSSRSWSPHGSRSARRRRSRSRSSSYEYINNHRSLQGRNLSSKEKEHRRNRSPSFRCSSPSYGYSRKPRSTSKSKERRRPDSPVSRRRVSIQDIPQYRKRQWYRSPSVESHKQKHRHTSKDKSRHKQSSISKSQSSSSCDNASSLVRKRHRSPGSDTSLEVVEKRKKHKRYKKSKKSKKRKRRTSITSGDSSQLSLSRDGEQSQSSFKTSEKRPHKKHKSSKKGTLSKDKNLKSTISTQETHSSAGRISISRVTDKPKIRSVIVADVTNATKSSDSEDDNTVDYNHSNNENSTDGNLDDSGNLDNNIINSPADQHNQNSSKPDDHNLVGDINDKCCTSDSNGHRDNQLRKNEPVEVLSSSVTSKQSYKKHPTGHKKSSKSAKSLDAKSTSLYGDQSSDVVNNRTSEQSSTRNNDENALTDKLPHQGEDLLATLIASQDGNETSAAGHVEMRRGTRSPVNHSCETRDSTGIASESLVHKMRKQFENKLKETSDKLKIILPIDNQTAGPSTSRYELPNQDPDLSVDVHLSPVTPQTDEYLADLIPEQFCSLGLSGSHDMPVDLNVIHDDDEDNESSINVETLSCSSDESNVVLLSDSESTHDASAISRVENLLPVHPSLSIGNFPSVDSNDVSMDHVISFSDSSDNSDVEIGDYEHGPVQSDIEIGDYEHGPPRSGVIVEPSGSGLYNIGRHTMRCGLRLTDVISSDSDCVQLSDSESSNDLDVTGMSRSLDDIEQHLHVDIEINQRNMSQESNTCTELTKDHIESQSSNNSIACNKTQSLDSCSDSQYGNAIPDLADFNFDQNTCDLDINASLSGRLSSVNDKNLTSTNINTSLDHVFKQNSSCDVIDDSANVILDCRHQHILENVETVNQYTFESKDLSILCDQDNENGVNERSRSSSDIEVNEKSRSSSDIEVNDKSRSSNEIEVNNGSRSLSDDSFEDNIDTSVDKIKEQNMDVNSSTSGADLNLTFDESSRSLGKDNPDDSDLSTTSIEGIYNKLTAINVSAPEVCDDIVDATPGVHVDMGSPPCVDTDTSVDSVTKDTADAEFTHEASVLHTEYMIGDNNSDESHVSGDVRDSEQIISTNLISSAMPDSAMHNDDDLEVTPGTEKSEFAIHNDYDLEVTPGTEKSDSAIHNDYDLEVTQGTEMSESAIHNDDLEVTPGTEKSESAIHNDDLEVTP